MIVIDGVTKSYGSTVVVDDVSLVLPRGGVTAVIGPNGAGKSTLLSIIGRLLESDRGTVTVDGMDVASTPSRDLARRLAILRQDTHLSVRVTVRELVAFGRFPHSQGRLSAEDHEAVDEAVAFLELEPYADRFLDQLSGGQRQRAFVAMTLAQQTDYVMLDEPLASLDMRHSAAMMRLLHRMANELDRTVVVVIHDINFASWHADRIVAMRDGRVVADGPPADIVEGAVLSDVFDTPVDVHEVAGKRLGVYFG